MIIFLRDLDNLLWHASYPYAYLMLTIFDLRWMGLVLFDGCRGWVIDIVLILLAEPHFELRLQLLLIQLKPL